MALVTQTVGQQACLEHLWMPTRCCGEVTICHRTVPTTRHTFCFLTFFLFQSSPRSPVLPPGFSLASPPHGGTERACFSADLLVAGCRLDPVVGGRPIGGEALYSSVQRSSPSGRGEQSVRRMWHECSLFFVRGLSHLLALSLSSLLLSSPLLASPRSLPPLFACSFVRRAAGCPASPADDCLQRAA